MRGLIVLVVVGCSAQRQVPAKAEQGSAKSPAAAVVPVRTGADTLVDRTKCAPSPVPAASWLGKWDGTRPVDKGNSFAHVGPTRITIKGAGDKLHVVERTADYQVDLALDPDGIVARGQSYRVERTSHGLKAISAAVAACFDAHDVLHYWRVLELPGGAAHEESEVELAAVTLPPRQPVPAGFRVIAEDESPLHIALTPDEIVWSTAVPDVSTIQLDGSIVRPESAIRAAPRHGGAMRELATGLDDVGEIVVHGDYVYFEAYDMIGRVPLAGGKIEPIVSGGTSDLTVDDDHIAWVEYDSVYVASLSGEDRKRLYQSDDTIMAIALADGSLYVATLPLHRKRIVARVSMSGAVKVLGSGDFCTDDMVIVDGAPILGTCDGAIVRVRGRVQTLATGYMGVHVFAVAGDTLVFGVGDRHGMIGAMPLAGGEARTVLKGKLVPAGLAVDPNDPSTIYVLDSGWAEVQDSVVDDDQYGRIGAVAL